MSDTPPHQAPPTQHGGTKLTFADDLDEKPAVAMDEEEYPPSVEMMDLTSTSYALHSPPPTGTCLLPSSSSNQDKLVFNFLYNNNTLQQTESHGEMRCPWCHLYCERLYSLLKHMSLSHPRFHYTYTVRACWFKFLPHPPISLLAFFFFSFLCMLTERMREEKEKEEERKREREREGGGGERKAGGPQGLLW